MSLTNFQCFNPQILMASPFFRMFSPFFQTPSSFQLFPSFSDHCPTPKAPPACDVPRRGSHLSWPPTSASFGGKMDPFHQEWGRCFHEMMDFTMKNDGFHQLQNRNGDFSEISRWNIGKNGNWSIKWWMNHDNLDDSRGYTWIYSQRTKWQFSIAMLNQSCWNILGDDSPSQSISTWGLGMVFIIYNL